MSNETTPAVARQVERRVSRLAWMIEQVAGQAAGMRPLWFDGQGFADDPNKGLQFSSREAAKELFDFLHRHKRIKLGYDCYAITEHAWTDLDAMRMDWLQEQAEAGCVTMCFELDGGFHVTLDPVGEDQRAAREVNTVRDGIDRLMTANVGVQGQRPDHD